jgi:hypothetical protein
VQQELEYKHAGLVGGVYPPVGLTETEEYDGTSWTAVVALNTSKTRISWAGIQTAA